MKVILVSWKERADHNVDCSTYELFCFECYLIEMN